MDFVEKSSGHNLYHRMTKQVGWRLTTALDAEPCRRRFLVGDLVEAHPAPQVESAVIQAVFAVPRVGSAVPRVGSAVTLVESVALGVGLAVQVDCEG